MTLQGTITEVNLMKAFAGESQARNRYDFYSDVAKSEGYNDISNVLKHIANNEKIHAEIFYNHMLKYGDYKGVRNIEIEADYPVIKEGTKVNIKNSLDFENNESQNIYPLFANIAKEEGFTEISDSFNKISSVENHHKEVLMEIYNKIENNQVFNSDKVEKWECLNCGFIHNANSAPEICPTCKVTKAYYKISN